MTLKRFLLIGFGALLLIIVALQIATPGGRRYRADSMVILKPYTNAFLARSFESHIIQTCPGVLALNATPAYSARPGSGVPVLTNGVGIRVLAVGRTPEGAQRAANEAAAELCRTAMAEYGASGELVDRANSARKFSYFHATLQPTVARLFKR